MALALAVALALPASSARAQDTAWGLILQVTRAQQLAEQTLKDVQTPLGAVLARISPGSAYATGERGLGYWALSLGATGLRFDITNPDYTQVDAAGHPASITGPFGAAYADLEVGIFSGYSPGHMHDIGCVDVLLRGGVTIGDQGNLANEVDLQHLGPLLGAGLRVGLLRGDGLPSISLSSGVNFFDQRTFKVRVQQAGNDYDITLELRQNTFFLLGEISKQFWAVTPYGGGGLLHHHLEASYAAQVAYSTGSVEVHGAPHLSESESIVFGGLELGSGFLRIVGEGGASGGEPYGTFYLRFTP